MSDGASDILSALPTLAALAAAGATFWIISYWSWRAFSVVTAVLVVRAPLAVLAWISRAGSGADRLRKKMVSAVTLDEGDAQREVRFPNLVQDIHAHAIRRLGALEKDSSLTRLILRDEEVERETERGRTGVLPSLREDKSLIELALGGKERLSAFLSLEGSGKLDDRQRAAALAILARSPEVEARKVAAYHLERLISAVNTSKENIFTAAEVDELKEIRRSLGEFNE